jgi:N-acetylmuramoyl-L-alanine amidase
MRERVRAIAAFLLVIGLFCGAALSFGGTAVRGATAAVSEQMMVADTEYVCVILDAGHGGEDGGAVSAAGAAEKSLNLSIALTLGDMLSSCGVDVIYTRTDDNGLYDGAVAGHRKMTDLKNRLAVRRAYPDALFLSIHMNTFSDPRCHGMQVFYSDNDPTSKELAECLRQANRTYLQTDNSRAVKAADASIYLLDRAEGTAVLAECGFLSNPTEAAHLMTAEYREQTAAVLCVGILNYIKEYCAP